MTRLLAYQRRDTFVDAESLQRHSSTIVNDIVNVSELLHV